MSDQPFGPLGDTFLQLARSVHALRLTTDGTIRVCNAAAARSLGAPGGELAGRSIFEWLTVADAARLRDELHVQGRRSEPVLLNFSDAQHQPYTLEAWLDVDAAGATIVGEPPLRDQRQRERELLEVSQALAVLSRERSRLASDEQHARRDAETASREKDRAIATIAHELRQPLGPLRFALEIIAGNAPDRARERALGAMSRQVTQLTRLVEDLLDAARLGEEKLTLERTRIDLAGLLRDLADAFQQKASAASVAFDLRLPGSPAWVLADAGRITQVFSNLFENALKFTEPGGRITVGLSTNGDRALVAVRDTGRGIAPEMLPRIFKMFAQQGEGERGGLGIGLAVAHGIVTLHGGTIEARSDGVGQGAEFQVSLPIDAAQPPGSQDLTSVRRALPEDLDPLARLWHDTWNEAHAAIVPPALTRLRTIDSFRERLHRDFDDLRVVGPPGAPLGFCLIKGDELYQLFVSPAARGGAAAGALLEDGERRLREAGVDTAFLACAIGNDRAARFYEKRGWYRAGTMVNRAETQEGEYLLDVWRYEKRLSPASV